MRKLRGDPSFAYAELDVNYYDQQGKVNLLVSLRRHSTILLSFLLKSS